MYKIFVFNGGVYKFEELEEFVEDSGGLILRRDDFHVTVEFTSLLKRFMSS